MKHYANQYIMSTKKEEIEYLLRMIRDPKIEDDYKLKILEAIEEHRQKVDLEKMIFIILGIYLLVIISLFLLVLFAKRKAKVKVYGLKTSLIFILCFLVGYFAVPLAFQDMAAKIVVQLIVFIRDYGWLTHEMP